MKKKKRFDGKIRDRIDFWFFISKFPGFLKF